MSAKNPRTPPAPLTREPDDVSFLQTALWRIHRVAGGHASQWNELREYGPVSNMRWDPHPTPKGDHPGAGVMYASPDLETVVAEVFQAKRVVTLSGNQALIGWVPLRPLSLLALTGTWALRNGASASLHAAPRSVCRAWAHAIHQAWPDLDGMLVTSTMTGKPSVVLFTASATSFPALPAFSSTLDQRAARSLIIPAARRFGWPVA